MDRTRRNSAHIPCLFCGLGTLPAAVAVHRIDSLYDFCAEAKNLAEELNRELDLGPRSSTGSSTAVVTTSQLIPFCGLLIGGPGVKGSTGGAKARRNGRPAQSSNTNRFDSLCDMDMDFSNSGLPTEGKYK